MRHIDARLEHAATGGAPPDPMTPPDGRSHSITARREEGEGKWKEEGKWEEMERVRNKNYILNCRLFVSISCACVCMHTAGGLAVPDSHGHARTRSGGMTPAEWKRNVHAENDARLVEGRERKLSADARAPPPPPGAARSGGGRGLRASIMASGGGRDRGGSHGGGAIPATTTSASAATATVPEETASDLSSPHSRPILLRSGSITSLSAGAARGGMLHPIHVAS